MLITLYDHLNIIYDMPRQDLGPAANAESISIDGEQHGIRIIDATTFIQEGIEKA